MIRLEDFSIGYGKKFLLKETATEFTACKLTALIGRNGAGKSTLLRALCALNDNYSGSIYVDDKNIKTISRAQLAKQVAFVTTKRPGISNLKCEEVVALGRSPYTDWSGHLTKKDKEIIGMAMASVGMTEYAVRSLDSLSDGESQKIMIARALAQDTKVILLDEPTSFLDMPTRFEVVGLLKKLAHDQGKTILFSTHELDIALEMSDYIALIDNAELHNLPVGEMLESGYIQKLFNNPYILKNLPGR